jgi:hypothetical protein
MPALLAQKNYQEAKMKRLIVLLTILSVLGFAYAVFAGEGAPPITETIPVQAHVNCWVKLEVTDSPDLLTFSGPYPETEATTFSTHKETNCDVWYKAEVTQDLTMGTSTIPTYIEHGNNLCPSDQKLVTLFNPAGSVWDDTFSVCGKAATPPLAGDYSGVITLTVTE